MGKGQPKLTKYDKLVKPRLAEIQQWRRDAVTLPAIAEALGVNRATLHNYRKRHDELARVLDDAEVQMYRDMANVAENSLKRKLRDRMETVEETVEVWTDDKGKIKKQHKVSKRRLILADTTAIIFTLKKRRPDNWGDQENVATTGIENDGFLEALESEGEKLWPED